MSALQDQPVTYTARCPRCWSDAAFTSDPIGTRVEHPGTGTYSNSITKTPALTIDCPTCDQETK